ncbi:MAG: hypothetical protein ACUVX8_12480 [Candidatus Zipacnadales bacterium]
MSRRPFSIPLRLLLLVILMGGPLLEGCPSGAQAPDMKAVEAKLDQLQQDIDLLEEINRLSLTKAQLESLITQVEALHKAMQARQAGRLDILNLLQALLEEQKAALLKDEPVPPAVVRQIDTQVEKLKAYDTETDQELLRFAVPLKEILTPEQVDILTWVSEARLQALEYIEWMRTMSEEDYQAEAEVNAEALAEGRNITKEQILDLYATARVMSDEEYTQAKDRLADMLVPALRQDAESIDLVLIRRMQPERLPIVLRERLAAM